MKFPDVPVASYVMFSLAGLHVVAVRVLPGAGVPLHEHEHKDEVFDIVCGAGRLFIGGREIEAERGTTVVVPRGTPHGLKNTAPGSWIIRETVRERLYTRGTLSQFLVPFRLSGQIRSSVREPSRQFFCCSDEPLPAPPATTRSVFSLEGLVGSVVVLRPRESLSLGAERPADVICDPVSGSGRLRWDAHGSRLLPGTVAFMPASYHALIENDGDQDLILRITQRLRPSRREMIGMVRRAIRRRFQM